MGIVKEKFRQDQCATLSCAEAVLGRSQLQDTCRSFYLRTQYPDLKLQPVFSIRMAFDKYCQADGRSAKLFRTDGNNCIPMKNTPSPKSKASRKNFQLVPVAGCAVNSWHGIAQRASLLGSRTFPNKVRWSAFLRMLDTAQFSRFKTFVMLCLNSTDKMPHLLPLPMVQDWPKWFSWNQIAAPTPTQMVTIELWWYYCSIESRMFHKCMRERNLESHSSFPLGAVQNIVPSGD